MGCTRRAPPSLQAIQDQIAKLEKRHAVHIAAYGEGNERRLTGEPRRQGLCRVQGADITPMQLPRLRLPLSQLGRR